jgi:hypothetical protein
MLRAGQSQIGLNQDDWKKGRDRKKGIGVRLSIKTAGSVDEIAKRAKNAGITLKSEPHDTEWKSRAFEVSDPSGFLLTVFSEHRRKPETGWRVSTRVRFADQDRSGDVTPPARYSSNLEPSTIANPDLGGALRTARSFRHDSCPQRTRR